MGVRERRLHQFHAVSLSRDVLALSRVCPGGAEHHRLLYPRTLQGILGIHPPPRMESTLAPGVYSVGPPQVLPPKKKQQAASSSAFAVWAKNRPRPPRLTEAEVPIGCARQKVSTDAPVAGIEGPESGPESPSGAGECHRAAAGPPNATR